MIGLAKNERLVYAGHTALRAPDGTPLPSVPQLKIVPAEEADPGLVTQLAENERLILAGHVLTDRKRAEERFAALKAGRKPPPREKSVALYVVADKDGAERNEEKQKALNTSIAKDLAALFSLHMRKLKAEERQHV